MRMATIPIFQARCPICIASRKCEVHGKISKSEDEPYHCRYEWRLLQCTTCENVFTSRREIDFESLTYSYDPSSGEEEAEPRTTDNSWPPFPKRQMPEWISNFDLDDTLHDALTETYGALEADLPMLAAAGARACFDIASVFLRANSNARFEQKLEYLVKNGIIKAADESILGILIDAGNASIHRGFKLKIAQLQTIVEVLEHFIEENFVRTTIKRRLLDKMQNIAKGIPKKVK
jgi:Domain of unknown function (DUF4145)